MADINEQDLLNEIRFDIQEKDLIKARLVLASLGSVSRTTQRQALYHVTQADDDFAIPLLAGVIAKDPKLAQTFAFIQETLFSKVLESPKVALNILSQKKGEPEIRLLIEIAGEIPIKEAVSNLLEILTTEQDLATIQGTITALGMIGDPAAANPVSEFLYAGNRDIVIAAVRAMGQFRTLEAIEHLSKRLGGDSEIDRMILDILAKIETPEAVDRLNEMLGSHEAHIRTAGKKKMLAVGVTAVRVLVRNLSSNNKNLVIHSLNTLGDMGDGAAIQPVRKLLHDHPEDPNIRFAAYEALGKLPVDKEAFSLSMGLEDPDGSVRAAAAKAIDRNFNAPLSAGLMNMIGMGDDDASAIVRTIIDAQCDNIFVGLWEEDSFREPACQYLGKVHPDVRSHFTKVIEDAGLEPPPEPDAVLSAKVAAQARLKVFAVDDSKMILAIYRKVLHNLGYDPQLFEFPAGALKHIEKEKPAAVLTDLNMPDITGIELAKRMREKYSKEDLPIIMVTTQDEQQDNQAACAAGVNAIVQKPFTEEQIDAVLAEFVNPDGAQ